MKLVFSNGAWARFDANRITLAEAPSKGRLRFIGAMMDSAVCAGAVYWTLRALSLDELSALLVSVAAFALALWLGRRRSSRRTVLNSGGKEIVQSEYRYGHRVRHRSVSAGSISEIKFSYVSVSEYEGFHALVFSPMRLGLIALEGVTPIEADRVLVEVQRLGFKVLRDPAVPMLINIEHRGWFINPWAGSARTDARPADIQYPKER